MAHILNQFPYKIKSEIERKMRIKLVLVEILKLLSILLNCLHNDKNVSTIAVMCGLLSSKWPNEILENQERKNKLALFHSNCHN